jgi:high-affinity nickel-transport protein
VITLASIILLGFFLGMRHATDPDHVIAVSTIVSRERRISSAMLIGVLWGIGHSLTILAVGSAIVVFDVVIPPRLGLSMEFSVALMLIVLGLLNLTGILQSINEAFAPSSGHAGAHVHPHRHGSLVHTHLHVHGVEGHDHGAARLSWIDQTTARLSAFGIVRPLVVGIVHGLAGSAAVALLVLTAIPSPAWAVGYLLVFGGKSA